MYIGITISRSAYTPEAFAYEKYLTSLGHIVQLDYVLNPNNDINIYFMGLRPLWQKRRGKSIEIHEYQSLSTPPYARTKNILKQLVNSKPDGRIFLNEDVCSELNIKDNVPYIFRDMGVDKKFFQNPSENPLYDIVYSGSVSNRKGLIEILICLSKNYKIALIGSLTNQEREILNKDNIKLLGPMSREFIPDIYHEARYGLNYTPDIYPFNIQTSTKTLEYLAAGLGVISNRYRWSEEFFSNVDYQPIWIPSNFKTGDLQLDFQSSNIICKSRLEKYEWNYLLNNVNFEAFLQNCLNDKL